MRIQGRRLKPTQPVFAQPTTSFAAGGVNTSSSSRKSWKALGALKKASSRKSNPNTSPSSSNSSSPTAQQSPGGSHSRSFAAAVSDGPCRAKSNLGGPAAGAAAGILDAETAPGNFRGESPALSMGTCFDSQCSTMSRAGSILFSSSRGQSCVPGSNNSLAGGTNSTRQATGSSSGLIADGLDRQERSHSVSARVSRTRSQEIAPPNMRSSASDSAGRGQQAATAMQLRQQPGWPGMALMRGVSANSTAMMDLLSERQFSLPPIRTAMSPASECTGWHPTEPGVPPGN